MYLLCLKYLKVLGRTVSALYVVADRFEKMPDSTHLCIEGDWLLQSFGYEIKKVSNLARIAKDILARHTFILCTHREVV